MIPTDATHRDVLAGEFVLGALDAAAHDEVETALATDADLQRRVLAWEERLLPATLAGAPQVGAPPELWGRIATAVKGDRLSPSLPRRPSALDRMARRAWRSRPFWRTTTGLAAAAALALALLPARDISEPQTRFLVVLQARDAAGAETGPGWLIQVAADGTVRSTPLAGADPDRDHSLQLWTLWDPTRGPVSLGVLPPGGAVRLPPERLPQIAGGQLFEITLEPRSGSPTGRPTGRILYIGRAAQAAVQAL